MVTFQAVNYAIVSVFILLSNLVSSEPESLAITTYCVKSDDEGMVTEYHNYTECDTLSKYVSNVPAYFKSQTVFRFSPGIHLLQNGTLVLVTENETIEFLSLIGSDNSSSSILCTEGGGFEFRNIKGLRIESLNFTKCGWIIMEYSYPTMVAVKFDTIINLNLYNVIVEKSTGYGVMGYRLYGNSSIIDCLFQNNSGTTKYIGGNVAISYIECNNDSNITNRDTYLFIERSMFRYGSYVQNTTHPFASGLVIYFDCSNIEISLHSVTFIGNRGLNSYSRKPVGGGNMAVIFLTFTYAIQNLISISNSMFYQGISKYGGGLFVSYYSGSVETSSLKGELCSNVIKISNSHFHGNNATHGGGGIYFQVSPVIARGNCSNTNFVLNNCTFIDNIVGSTKDTGVALSIANFYTSGVLDMRKYDQFTALIEYCNFSHNLQKITFANTLSKSGELYSQSSAGSAVLHVSEQNGKTTIKDTIFQQNFATALGAFRSQLTFEGNVTIINNTGINGGGILLCEASYMILTPNVTVTIAKNHAIDAGGGIYSGGHCLQATPLCFFLVDNATVENGNSANTTFQVILVDNTAVRAGTQLYGGFVETCYVPNHHITYGNSIFRTIFNFPDIQPSDYSYITSDPIQVCFCNDVRPNCSIHSIDRAVYSGEQFEVPAVVVGQLNGIVPGYVTTKVSRTSLGFRQLHQYLRNCSSKLNYTVYSKDDVEKILPLSIENFDFSENIDTAPLLKHIHVTLKRCPFGFEIVDVQKPSCKCIESPDIFKHGFQCHINNQTIQRPQSPWIGVHHSNSSDAENDGTITGLIYHYACPLDYCRDEVVYIQAYTSTLDQDAQCANNRTGILCGRCSDGYSAILGSSRCLDCSVVGYKAVFAFTVLYAIAGVLLVALLVICNLTITECTLSGIVFYVNVFSLLMPIFVPRTTQLSSIETTVVFMVSLINLDVEIELCLYDGMTRYAKNWLEFLFPIYIWAITALVIYLSRKYTSFANTIGDKAVQVLATLFLLSYMKINQAVVNALSFTTLSLPGPNRTFVNKVVWLNDGNIQYLHGQHIPLFICGAIFGILSLTYTFILLFIQPLQKYNHLKCFKWVGKLKPLVDAYTSPKLIKETNQFWNGFLLSIRVILIIYFATNFTDDPHANLTGIVVACIIVLTVAWSVGGVYTKWQLNVLNSFSVINLAVFSVISISHNYRFDKEHQSAQKRQAENSIVSLSIVLLMSIGVLMYHLHQLIGKRQYYERARNFFRANCAHFNCCKKPQYQRLLVRTVSYSESENESGSDNNDDSKA